MAEKGFGVKEVNLIGASGTPTITSPNNLNLNANNVAISTNVSIGGTLSVTGNVSVGGTLTYEDVTSIDSVGIITARSDVIVGRGLTVTGISTFSGDVHFSLHNSGNPKIEFDESANLLWFKAPTTGGTSSKLWLGNGTSYNNLELVTDYTGGGLAQMNVANANLIIRTNNTGKNIELQSQNDLTLANGTYPFIKGEKNSGSDQSVTLYYGQTGSTPYANPKLVTTSTGVTITGTAVATTFSGSGASLTELPAGSLTGTVADARISTLTASKLSGALPAISGANLTNIPAPVEAPVVNFTVTANGSSAYRFSGGGVDTSANNPDLYLIRGQKYRFNKTTGSAHPFQFRLTTGGSAYTAGVTGDQNGVQFFTPEQDAPARLYYICTLHSGMVGNVYINGGQYGSMTLLASATLSSSGTVAANITFNTAGFQYLYGKLHSVTRPSGDIGDVGLRWNGTSSTVYDFVMQRMDNGGTGSTRHTQGANQFYYNMNGVAGWTSGRNQAVFELHLVNDGVRKPFNMKHSGELSGGPIVLTTDGMLDVTSSITSLEITTSNTDINGGTLELYGVR